MQNPGVIISAGTPSFNTFSEPPCRSILNSRPSICDSLYTARLERLSASWPSRIALRPCDNRAVAHDR